MNLDYSLKALKQCVKEIIFQDQSQDFTCNILISTCPGHNNQIRIYWYVV